MKHWSKKSYWTTTLVDFEYRKIREFELNFMRVLRESFQITLKNFSEQKVLPSNSGSTRVRFK